ncbi:ATP-binding protein [Limnoglobus roseus]|uniref:ATP-binding protein n=1 Tax=Limnoglobus roseus TaxID=2598579 RepID=A0A5C1A814_9BACT|nr:ATP-binding protein [Limnoglobus roseus]QEL15341.1 ATP-binding protein [Limnoglobus roseus]
MSRTALGRVAAPPEHESTSGVFYFWVDRDQSVERTQIVTTKSTVAGREVAFVGIVQEVYRRSRQKDVGEEAARFDGRSAETPPFASEGVTYAEVAILRTDPVAHTPPTEESEVFLGDEVAAAKGYGMDRMGQRFDVGLLRNGGTEFAGRAAIDLDFLLGKNGGHLNVNGIAGLGTKSTLLLSMNWLLLREAKRQREEKQGDPKRLQVVPVIFNVKNFDLFFIDRWNTEYRKEELAHREDWRRMGVDEPRPFDMPRYFAPQAKGLSTPVQTGGRTTDVLPYSWSLADVIEQELFSFLFSEEDVYDPNFGGLVGEMEEYLTSETAAGRKLRKDGPQTFADLLDWFRDERDSLFMDFVKATKGKLLRRLKYIVQEGDGVLVRKEPKGNALKIPSVGQDSPIVIDLYGLHGTPSLQRFVVAAVFHQIQQIQSAKQVANLKYLITLDELNRFAPKDSSDPITQKLETIASEGRSQGIILFGAQQQASLVKPRVIENAAIRAIGRSGTLELGAEVWKFLGPSARSAASQLQPEEKLLYQPSFREPMLAKIPFPPFALSENDADSPPATGGGDQGLPPVSSADLDAF